MLSAKGFKLQVASLVCHSLNVEEVINEQLNELQEKYAKNMIQIEDIRISTDGATPESMVRVTIIYNIMGNPHKTLWEKAGN